MWLSFSDAAVPEGAEPAVDRALGRKIPRQHVPGDAGGAVVRGEDRRSGSVFSYVAIEKRVRPDHPLRTIKTLVERRWRV